MKTLIVSMFYILAALPLQATDEPVLPAPPPDVQYIIETLDRFLHKEGDAYTASTPYRQRVAAVFGSPVKIKKWFDVAATEQAVYDRLYMFVLEDRWLERAYTDQAKPVDLHRGLPSFLRERFPGLSDDLKMRVLLKIEEYGRKDEQRYKYSSYVILNRFAPNDEEATLFLSNLDLRQKFRFLARRFTAAGLPRVDLSRLALWATLSEEEAVIEASAFVSSESVEFSAKALVLSLKMSEAIRTSQDPNFIAACETLLKENE